MVYVVSCAVVGLLKADNAIQAVRDKLGILLSLERHNLDFQVAEIWLCQIQCPSDVVNTRYDGVFARHKQQILKGPQLLDGSILLLYLRG